MWLYASRFDGVCLFGLPIGEFRGVVNWFNVAEIPHSGIFILIERPLAYELYSSIRFLIIGLSKSIHLAKYLFFKSRILYLRLVSLDRRRSGSFPNSFFFFENRSKSIVLNNV